MKEVKSLIQSGAGGQRRKTEWRKQNRSFGATDKPVELRSTRQRGLLSRRVFLLKT
jgi:hypothetical protein